jgi:predicted permease
MSGSIRPPRLAELLMERVLASRTQLHGVIGDLREEYSRRRGHSTRVLCDVWFWRQAVGVYWRFRSESRLRELARRQGGAARLLGDLLSDIRFALRTLRKRPVFAATAVLTLGAGIGGTTAIFSVVDGVLIRDLPYSDPERLVNVWKAWPSWQGVEGLDYTWDHIQYPWPDFLTLRDHATTLSAVAAFQNMDRVLTGVGEPERLSVGGASPNLFNLLGVPPVLGRVFSEEEVPPAVTEGAKVVILSHELWTRRFGADRDVLGRTIALNGAAHEVVGVLPAGFRLGSDLITTHENGGAVDPGLRDAWVPLMRQCGNCNELLARLEPGITVDQARAEVQALMTEGPDDQLARVALRKEVVTKGFGTPLLVLLGAAGILLLVACVNVAGLLVGEATGRRHEIAVRSALGAGRWRVVRQLLTENVLLGIVGAVLGLVLARIGTDALLMLAPPIPRLEEVGLSGRVLFFAAGAGVGTGIAFGLAPVMTLAGQSIGGSFVARGQSGGRRGRILQRGVMTVQVGLTVVLLVAGGLFGRSLLRLMAVDPGFDAGGVVAIEVSLPVRRSAGERQAFLEDGVQLFRDAVRAVEGIPGITAVSGTNYVPFGGGTWTGSLQFERDGERISATHWIRRVLPDYHEMMGIPLKTGRLFSDADGPSDPPVLLVSESLAEMYWPGASPLGTQASYGQTTFTVVGVVGDVRKTALGADPEPTFYMSAVQIPGESLTFVARTTADLSQTGAVLRRAIRSTDPNLLIGAPTTMSELMVDSESDDRFRTVLMLTFAALATLLAAVGVFGVTARAVASRVREMGIRMALGARESGLIRLVVNDAMISVAVGAVLGLVGAFWASNLIERFLFGIDGRDPLTYAGVVSLLMFVSFGAAYLPAMRVAKIAPMEVISAEE